jgi:hypothetical protein
VSFDELSRRYLDEYRIREYRTPDTAAGRVKNLRTFFEAMTAETITTGHLQQYQAARRRAGAAAATVNRETAALKKMFRLPIAAGRLTTMPFFPQCLPDPPRQGFSSMPSVLPCVSTCRHPIRTCSTLRITPAGGTGKSPNSPGTKSTRPGV